MQRSKKALIIAYYFPPCGGGGVQRTLKFVKYLPPFGWRPVVLTAKHPGENVSDATMLSEVPGDVNVYQTNLLLNVQPFAEGQSVLLQRLACALKKLFIPDKANPWVLPTVLKGLEICNKERCELIYTTSPPASAHLVGYALKRLTKKPWVVDFRDPWTQNAYHLSTKWGNPGLRYRIEEEMEYRVLRDADGVIANTRLNRQNLIKKYGDMVEGKVVTITNGYDEADFEGLNASSALPFKKKTRKRERESTGKLVITYTGDLYANTARTFLFALAQLVREKKLWDKIEMRFVGRLEAPDIELIDQLGLQKVVKLIGYVPHRESIKYLLRSHALLLIVYSGKGGKGWVPGKLYEYLRAKRPIVCIAPPDGCAAEYVAQARAGFIVAPNNMQLIKERLLALYAMYEAHTLDIQPEWTMVERFDRRNLTKQLAQLFNRVSKT